MVFSVFPMGGYHSVKDSNGLTGVLGLLPDAFGGFLTGSKGVMQETSGLKW